MSGVLTDDCQTRHFSPAQDRRFQCGTFAPLAGLMAPPGGKVTARPHPPCRLVPKCLAFRWGNQVSEKCCCWVDGLRVSGLPSAFQAPHPGPRQATYPYVVLRVPPSREPKMTPMPKQRPSRPRAAGRSAGAVRSVMTIWAAVGGRGLNWTRPLLVESPPRGPGHSPSSFN